MSKKSLMFVITIIVIGLFACEMRRASAVSSKEKVAFVQGLDARLSNPEEVDAWIKKHPSIAKEVFYEIAFDEVWVHITPVFGEHSTPFTKENQRCLESIRDALALSSSHLTWLQSCFNRDVKSSVMPEEFLSLHYYLQAIEQLDQQNWEAYEQLMQACMQQAQNASIKLAEAHALAGLGFYSEWTKKDTEAVKYYEAALNLLKQMHAWDTINKIYSRLYRHTQRNAGKRYFKTGQYPKALEFFSLASDYAEQLNDVTKQFASLASMANMEVILGRYHDAEGHLQTAFDRLDNDFQRLLTTKEPLRLDHLDKGLLREVGHALNISGTLDAYSGRLKSATEKYGKAQMIASTLDEKLLLADVTHNIGRQHERSGNLREAINRFKEAIKLYQSLENENQTRLGEAYMNLGAAYVDRKEIKQAKIYYGKAWDLFEIRENQTRKAQLLNHRGILADIEGNRPLSIIRYKQAVQLTQTALPDSPNFSARQAALLNLGTAYMKQESYKDAIETFQKGLSLKPLRIEIEVAMLNSLGAAQWKFGKAEDAKRILQRAEELARQNRLLPRWWPILFYLGHVYLTQQQPDTAQNCWERAIETIELLRYDLGGADRHRIRFMVDKHTVYADLVALLIQQGDTAKAFEYVQRAKARTFLDMLYGSGIDLRVGIDSALLDKEQELQRAIATTRIQWIETQQDRLNKQIIKLEADLMDVRNLILEQNPKFHKLFRGQIASPIEIQSQLNDRTILLEYFVTEEKIFLFSVSKEGIQNYELPIAPEELNSKITTFRNFLQAPVATGHSAGPAYNNFVETSLELYQHLVKPAEKTLSQTDHLVIAPHDILYAVPFAALVVDKKTPLNAKDPSALGNYQGLDYLVKNYSLSYVPSATVLVGLPPKQQAAGEILGFGHPSTSKESPVGKGEIEMLSQLPHAEIYKEKNATETRLKTLPLDKYKILHFATHGVFNNTDPFFSYVELGATNNPLEDGRLHAYEVLRLTSKAALVILSGCSTGQRPSSKEEGMVSLTRAFLASGTPSVLSTLWKIEDTPTEHLMRMFYASLSPDVEAVAALRESQLALIQNSSPRQSRRGSRNLAHPHFWAGFVLIGRF